MHTLTDLNPKALWNYFDQICQIPRPSKHEAKMTEFVKSFGLSKGLKTHVDDAGNVIISKPATPGYENRKGVILQSHLDMVPQKDKDVDHDFEADPIKTSIEDGWVRADRTTLGADNGIGVASMLAILDANDLTHGPLEALFTVDEETGMTGAFQLAPGILKGHILLNLDSEDENELFIGCAGGLDANIKLHYIDEHVPRNSVAYQIHVSGLKGGHSGLDIHLGRGNAIKILNRILWIASKDFGIRISEFNGGSLRNAIPRDASAIITLDANSEKDFVATFEKLVGEIKDELRFVESNLDIQAEQTEIPFTVIEEDAHHLFLNSVYGCPNGVIRMSDAMPGVVETSTNLSIVNMEHGIMNIQCLLRSSVDSAKTNLANMIDSVFHLANGDISFDGGYPGWNPNPDSAVLEVMKDSFKQLKGKLPEIKVIHAGLECGIIGAKYPKLDMISFGPTIRDPHSPTEKVNIKSVENYWNLLLLTLKNIPAA